MDDSRYPHPAKSPQQNGQTAFPLLPWDVVILGLCTFLAHATLFIVPVSAIRNKFTEFSGSSHPRLKFKGALGWYREWRVLTYA